MNTFIEALQDLKIYIEDMDRENCLLKDLLAYIREREAEQLYSMVPKYTNPHPRS